MKKIKNKQIFVLLTVLIFLLGVSFLNNYEQNIEDPINQESFNTIIEGETGSIDNYPIWEDGPEFPIPQYWVLSPFIIDDYGNGDYTWEEISNQEWCSGSGTWTDPYVIENITINGQGLGSCIEIWHSNTYFIIRNCSLYNSGSLIDNAGIYLYNVNNSKIINNNCSDNYNGIEMYYSNNNTLSGNTVDNIIYHGIYLGFGNNNTLSGNLMNFCGILVWGSLVESASQNIDDTNLVNNKPVYYYVNEIDLGSTNFTNAGQIILVNCSNSIISGLNLSNSTIGIDLHYSNNNTISGNIASNNYYGIGLVYCDNNTLLGNIANNNTYGIVLALSNNNTISENTASNNNMFGIATDRCYNTKISNNIANNNSYGIVLAFTNNSISFKNILRGNSINGVFIYGGIHSTKNLFFENIFLRNNIHAYDNGINNYWNNSIIGNYWDNYTGIDANHDGIGDIPYYIPGLANSKDNFPIWDDGEDIFPPSSYLDIVIELLVNLEVPEITQNYIENAILFLAQAKEKFESGMIYEAFDKMKDAVGFLMEAEELGASTQEIIDSIIFLTQYIVEFAMEKTIDIVGDDNKFIIRAKDDYNTALLMIELEEYDKAVMFFKNSLRNIMKARTKLIIESFVSDLHDRLTEIQELISDPITPDQALFDLEQAEQMLLLAIDQANKTLLESSFYKLIELVLNLLDAEANGVSTSSIIESIMSNIDDVTYLKILEAESLLLGESNRHLDKAWVYYTEAQELWDDDNLKSAITYYAKVIGKVKYALK